MRSGRFVYNQTDISIGNTGDLAVTRSLRQQVAGHNNPFANFSHNWDILISEKRISIHQGTFTHPSGPDYQIEISSGGLTDTFRSQGPTNGYDHVSRSGYASLTFSGTKDSAGAVYTYRRGDGMEAVFRPIGSNDCSSTLRCAYVSHVTQSDGTRYDFEYDNQGSNTTRLRSVTSNRGYALLFEYSGSLIVKACTRNLTDAPKPADNVCPEGAPSALYSYDSEAGGIRLASVIDPSGATWGFVNTTSTIGFVNPGASAPWLTNQIWQRGNDDGLVEDLIVHQTFADGSSYSYGWNSSPPVEGHVAQIAGGEFSNTLGETTTVTFDFPVAPRSSQTGCVHNGCPWYWFEDTPAYTNSYQITPGPTAVTDPLGRTTTYNYCDANAMANLPANEHDRCVVTPMPISSRDPEGIVTNMTWDFFRGNLLQTVQVPKSGSTLNPIQRSATYDCTPAAFRYCTKPTSVTDGRGNTRSFAYSVDHGGLLTETGPAVNGVHPQTRHSYTLRHAWVLHSSGSGYVQAPTGVYLLASTSICRTSAPTGDPGAPCTIAGDEVLTQFEYGPDSGPNNLLLRGQTVTSTDPGPTGAPVTTTLRACYTYDGMGRRISETQPNGTASLTSCP